MKLIPDKILKFFNKTEVEEIRTSIPSNKNIFKFENKTSYRVNADIKKWRNALNQAEDILYPDRTLLMKLYNEVILDPIVKNSIDLRIQRILTMPFSIVTQNDKYVDKNGQKLFSDYWFEHYITLVMESIFYGHSLIQIDGIENSSIKSLTLIPRAHIIPEMGLYKKAEYDTYTAGIDYMEPKTYKWLIEAYHDRKDLGLLSIITPYQIYKKVAITAWTQFVEKFGEPITIGRTNSNLESEKQSLQQFLQNLSMSSSAVLDNQTDIEFRETSRSDAFNVYKELLKSMNDEITTVILGATELTSGASGGSEARANVHQYESAYKTEADMRFITNHINKVLIPKLHEFGLISNKSTFKFNSNELISMNDKIKIDQVILQHYKLDPEYIETMYQVKIQQQQDIIND